MTEKDVGVTEQSGIMKRGRVPGKGRDQLSKKVTVL
jgi:hypothetical protein